MAHPWTRARHGPGHAPAPAPPRPRGRMTRQGETHHRITARGVCLKCAALTHVCDLRRGAAGQGTEPHDSGCLWCAAPGAGAGGRSGGSTTTTWSRRRGPRVYGRAAGPRQPVFEEPILAGILFGSHRVSGGDERGGHYHRAGAPEKSGGRILPMTRSRSLGSARLCYRLCLD
jgi:hypothetical protein